MVPGPSVRTSVRLLGEVPIRHHRSEGISVILRHVLPSLTFMYRCLTLVRQRGGQQSIVPESGTRCTRQERPSQLITSSKILGTPTISVQSMHQRAPWSFIRAQWAYITVRSVSITVRGQFPESIPAEDGATTYAFSFSNCIHVKTSVPAF